MANVRAGLVLGLLTALVSQGCAPTMTTNYAKESTTESSRDRVLRALDGLRVAPELQHCAYDRGDYPHSQSLENR